MKVVLTIAGGLVIAAAFTFVGIAIQYNHSEPRFQEMMAERDALKEQVESSGQTPADPVEAAEPEKPAAAEPEPEYTPTPENFELTIVETERLCYGSAGCNVSYRVELGYGGPPLDPSTTYELTYEVLGAEDKKISTMEVTGDQHTVNEDFVSVPP